MYSMLTSVMLGFSLQLGEAFTGDDSVIIAKLDATANDVPSDKFQARIDPCAVPYQFYCCLLLLFRDQAMNVLVRA